MRKLVVFNTVTVDGYFTGANGDMSWAHKNDPEWQEFTSGNARGESVMVFGRVTYQMMAGWWPSPQAMKVMPDVAGRMNSASKIVFSRTLNEASWNNTTLVKTDPASAIQKIKKESGPDLIIFGSGTIVSLLAEHGLIDEYQIVLSPIVLGRGRTMFEGVKQPLNLKLTGSRSFKNGNVVLYYQPAK
ncbi:MAG TPA: dihydrofolate reductase family protein [Opitutaceae bacterium]|nr:dihydrofolate reductase family protein [Opitutaceae bacterium]